MLNDELENSFENTIISQLFIDANLILRKFTRPAMRQFTLSADDIGRNIRDVAANIRYPTLIENIQEVIETGKNLEKEIQTLDLKWYQMNILPYIIRKENRTNGVIITFVDITNRIKILQEVQKLNSDHETIIYSISQDIKQPLSALGLMPDSLEYAYNNNDAELFASNIGRLGRAVASIKFIVDGLTDLVKNDTGLSAESERVNIENIYEDVTLTLKDEIYQKQVTINTQFNTSEIIFSRKNLRSILYNLLSNAIKYSNPLRPCEILLKTEKIKGFVLLCVRDNGIGIELENYEMIFKRYTRIHNDNNENSTGMGLYLVRSMIEMARGGGKIEVESTFGEGTVFKVYFKN